MFVPVGPVSARGVRLSYRVSVPMLNEAAEFAAASTGSASGHREPLALSDFEVLVSVLGDLRA